MGTAAQATALTRPRSGPRACNCHRRETELELRTEVVFALRSLQKPEGKDEACRHIHGVRH